MDPRLNQAQKLLKIINIILMTDAYKLTHWKMYPKGLEFLFSYFESRGGVFPSTVFFGLQMILKKYFVGEVLTQAMITEADDFCRKVFGQNLFNKEGWQYILDKYKGKLPLRIMAVPEGLDVPVSNVLMTVENTDPNIPWLTNWAETVLV
jgi:nicotinamide phosphoribosyltransferase